MYKFGFTLSESPVQLLNNETRVNPVRKTAFFSNGVNFLTEFTFAGRFGGG